MCVFCVRFIPRLEEEVCLVFLQREYLIKISLSCSLAGLHSHTYEGQDVRLPQGAEPRSTRRREEGDEDHLVSSLPPPSSSSSSSLLLFLHIISHHLYTSSKVCADPKHSCEKNKIRSKAWANCVVAMMLRSKRFGVF